MSSIASFVLYSAEILIKLFCYLYSFKCLCMVMFRLKWENLTSISFLGFRGRCQYLSDIYTFTIKDK